ncbi:MAG: sigma-54-dependent Fis family transcriptional regulator [Gammaproteobacteria bacterium]|nr:sigma-54-dependent Fis family transcriptional regulator [Gammaproteobacteria bacterium]
MARYRALVVDDEPDILELIEITLGRMDIDTTTAADLAAAREQLGNGARFDLCLTDMRLPDGSGLDLVAEIQASRPDLPVAVITAYGSMDTAVQALKAGAFDFVSKPVDLQVLRNLVGTALKLSDTRSFPARDRRSRDELIGDSAPMQRIRALIAKLARSQAPVYISGESGTGKELVARLIHDKGPRAEQPFIAVNCGAIPAELMESEFFGHRKGSFTGAAGDKEGLFQAATGGTLFLDEVAELPLHMQVKLLRAIQEKAVRPVGEQREAPVDVRVLTATHKNLEQLVRDGHFRQDLYFRINVIELKVPPLRERREDIPRLVEHLLNKLGHDARHRLSDTAVQALQAYDFPGNVRELENILERAVTMAEGEIIEAEDLHLQTNTASDQPTTAGNPPPPGSVPLEDYLGEIEKQAILDALEQTNQNKTAAAELLGLSFRALRYRLKKLGLE